MYVFFSTRWAPPECYTYSLTPSLHDVLPVSVDRRGGEAVLAVHRPAPDRLVVERRHRASFERGQRFVNIDDRRARHDPLDRDAPVAFAQPRSEEHTSELQSLMRTSYAVFCLKKKTKNKHSNH